MGARTTDYYTGIVPSTQGHKTKTPHAKTSGHEGITFWQKSLCPVVPVERPILDGLRDVRGGDGFGAIEVGDRAGDLENAVVGAGGEAEAGHGTLKQALAVRRDVAVFPDLARAHLRVAVNLFSFEALQLALARLDDARADFRRTFSARTLPQFAVLHGGHVDVDIDAVEQRPGNFRDVALNHRRGTGALARRIVEEPARARVHRCGQHEAGGKRQRHGGTGDRHRSVFKWLAQHLQHVPRELGQLIEKEQAVVCQTHFARTRDSAAADQARVCYRVVRSTEWPHAYEARARFEQPGHAVDLGGLDGFVESERRQNRRDALGQHRLPSPRRADHQNVVAAGRSDFNGALGVHLAFDVVEIDVVSAALVQHFCRVHARGFEVARAVDQVNDFRQRPHTVNVNFAHYSCLRSILYRNDQPANSLLLSHCGDRKCALDWPNAAIERKFAEENVVLQMIVQERAAVCAEDAERNRKVKTRTFFLDVGRRQIDGDVLERVLEAAILDGGLNALAALADGGIRQADRGEIWVSGGDVHLDFDEVSVYSKCRGTESLEEHSNLTASGKGAYHNAREREWQEIYEKSLIVRFLSQAGAAHFRGVFWLALAARAEVAAAAGDHDAPDGGTTARTGLARFLIDLEPLKIVSRTAFDIDIVAEAGSLQSDSPLQDLLHRAVKPLRRSCRNMPWLRERMDARLEERFVRVNVTET